MIKVKKFFPLAIVMVTSLSSCVLFDNSKIENIKLIKLDNKQTVTSDKVLLAKNNMAYSRIVIAKDSLPTVSFAAKELQKYLGKVTGATFPIVNKPGVKPNIFLGDCNQARQAGLDVNKLKRDGFYRAIIKDNIFLLGRDTKKNNYTGSEIGTVTSVYDFLEDVCGVRWYFFGPLGEVVPKKKELKASFKMIKEEPFFIDRSLSSVYRGAMMMDAVDYVENKLATKLRTIKLKEPRSKGFSTLYYPRTKDTINAARKYGGALIRNQRFSSMSVVQGCHAPESLHLGERFGRKHPEWFAVLANGVRAVDHSYMCWSASGWVDELIKDARAFLSGKPASSRGLKSWRGVGYENDLGERTFMVDTSDGYPGCSCKRCQANIKKYWPKKPQGGTTDCYSDIIWPVVKRVAEAVKDIPKAKIVSLAYGPQRWPPKTINLPGNVAVRLCIPGYLAVASPNVHHYQMTLVREWSKRLKVGLVLWTYEGLPNNRTFLRGFPSISPHLIHKFYQDVKPYIVGGYSEHEVYNQTHMCLDGYIQLRHMWDPDVDVDKLLDEYFNDLYGPAAVPVRKFHAQLENLWIRILKNVYTIEANCRTENLTQKQVWLKLITLGDWKNLKSSISEAEALSKGKGDYEVRVNLLRRWLYDIMVSRRDKVKERYGLAGMSRITAYKCAAREKKYLSEQAWKNIPWSGHFSKVGYYRNTDKLPHPVKSVISRFKAQWNRKSLFLLIDCREPYIKGLVASPKRKSDDACIWLDNSFEIFLDFSTDLVPRYTQVIVNENGVLADQETKLKNTDWKWTSGAHIRTVTGPQGWKIEVSLPWKNMGVDSSDTKELKSIPFNIIQTRKIQNCRTEFYSWSSAAGMDAWADGASMGRLQASLHSVPGENILKNPSFEKIDSKSDLPVNWVILNKFKAKIAFDGKMGFASEHSQYIDHKTEDSTVFYQLLPNLAPDSEYLVSCMVKTENVKAKNRGGAYIAFMPDAQMKSKVRYYPDAGISGTCDWHYQEFIIKTSSASDKKWLKKAKVMFYLKHASGKVWFDNVSVRKLEERG